MVQTRSKGGVDVPSVPRPVGKSKKVIKKQCCRSKESNGFNNFNKMAAYVYFLDGMTVLDRTFVCRLPSDVTSYADMEVEVRKQLDLSRHFSLLYTKYKVAKNYFAELAVSPAFNNTDEFQLAFGMKKTGDSCPHLPINSTIIAQGHSVEDLKKIKKEMVESDEEVIWLPNPKEPKAFKITTVQEQVVATECTVPSTSTTHFDISAPEDDDDEYRYVDEKCSNSQKYDPQGSQTTINGEYLPPATSTVEIETTSAINLREITPPSRRTLAPMPSPMFRTSWFRLSPQEKAIQHQLQQYSLIQIISVGGKHLHLLQELGNEHHGRKFYVDLCDVLAWYFIKNSNFHTKVPLYPVVESLIRPFPSIKISELFGPTSIRLSTKLRNVKQAWSRRQTL